MRAPAAVIAASSLALALAACGHAPGSQAARAGAGTTFTRVGPVAGPALIAAANALGGVCAGGAQLQAHRASDLLIPDYVAMSNAHDLYSLVSRQRPRWLLARGQGGSDGALRVVYLDGHRAGGPEVLRSLPASSARLVRFLSAPQAHFKYGSNHSHGVIEVYTTCGR